MFSRRQIVGGVAALAATRPLDALAAFRCGPKPASNWVFQSCEAGLELGPIETVRQRCDWWCWAACIQAVFALNGRNVQQERAVERLFGQRICKPATGDQIIRTINGEWIDDRGGRFRAAARWLPEASLAVNVTEDPDSRMHIHNTFMASPGAVAIVDELKNNRPLIIGAVGHATVLSAVSYQLGGMTESRPIVYLTKLVIRDPAGQNPNRRELTVREVRDAFFVAKVEIVG